MGFGFTLGCWRTHPQILLSVIRSHCMCLECEANNKILAAGADTLPLGPVSDALLIGVAASALAGPACQGFVKVRSRL